MDDRYSKGSENRMSQKTVNVLGAACIFTFLGLLVAGMALLWVLLV